jgi:hypothetical protein
MRVVSLAEVERQIRREGARHGLFPLVQDGKCFVAEKSLSLNEGGVVGSVLSELNPICSVNMNAPLGNVWRSRKRRHEYNVARWYTEHRKAREAKEKARVDQEFNDRKAELHRLQRRFGRQDMSEALILAMRGMRLRRDG